MDVSWDKAMKDYVADRVESGDFENPTEVVRNALRMQKEYFRKLEALRREVQKGLDDIEAGRIVYPPPTIDELIASARLRKQQQS